MTPFRGDFSSFIKSNPLVSQILMYGFFATSRLHNIFVTRVAIDADALHIERSQEIKNIEIAVSISQVADLIDTSSP